VNAWLYLMAASLAAAGVVALHRIVRREPPGAPLPTARFVPPDIALMRVFAAAPEHRWLLALRVAALLLIGLGFAQPHLPQQRVAVLSILAVDRSTAVRDAREVVDSARALLDRSAEPMPRAGPEHEVRLIAFDSAAMIVAGPAIDDTLRQLHGSMTRGSLSVALAAALRVAGEWHDRADSFELTVVSPTRSDEFDAASASIRAMWPGDIRLVRVAARSDSSDRPGGDVQIEWPADGHPMRSARRAVVDTVGAVVVGDLVLVGALERRWQPDTAGARIVGRWVDGAPAAVERDEAAGCSREVAVAVDTGRDRLRRPDIVRVVRVLHSPCRLPVGVASRTPPVIRWRTSRPREGASGNGIPARAFALPQVVPSRLSTLLLALALVALVLEMVLRRGRPATRAS
jgi:hypothetical protein